MSKYQALIDVPSLHDQIMNIRCDRSTLDWANTREAYQYGHRDARHAAAELANAQDAAIRSLLADLERAEKDAERYRFLRSQHEDSDSICSLCVFEPINDQTLEPIGCMPGELDAAIDAALSQLKGQQ